MLEQIVGPKGRAAILKGLFGGRGQRAHIRELARVSHLSAPSLMREAKNLVRMGLLRESQDGNRVDYEANVDSPLYEVLKQLVEKTAGQRSSCGMRLLISRKDAAKAEKSIHGNKKNLSVKT